MGHSNLEGASEGSLLPKGSYVLLWGILPQGIIVIPNMETLHSTISVHRTLWVGPLKEGPLDLKARVI